MNELSILQWFGNHNGTIIIEALKTGDESKINKVYSEFAPQLRNRFKYSA